jgi:two-component system sensor histidine kinase GlrK
MKRYPRTFLQLITFGHILFALPLLIACGYVFVKLDILNKHYRDAIEHASSSSTLRGDLAEDLLHMERSLRRHLVLKDLDSLEDYARVRDEWRTTVRSLERLSPLPAAMIQEFESQLDLEQKAFQSVRDGGDIALLVASLEELKPRSLKSLEGAQQILDSEQKAFLDESNSLRNRLLLSASLAVLIATFFLWALHTVLARLIGRFEKVVVRLGKGDLQQAIELGGPGDLRWLGRWLEWLRRRLLSLEEARTQVLRHVSH